MINSKRPAVYWRNLWVFTAISVLIAFTGLTLYLSRARAYTLVHPGRTQPAQTPADLNVKHWEEVQFPSADGLTLGGWFIPPTQEVDGATIIFVHGMGGNRGEFLGPAVMLHKYGFGALLIDLRNHGASEGNISTFGLQEVLDVQGAVDYLYSRPEVNPERIGLIGHSMGGGAAIMAAAQIPEIRAVVSESAYTSLEDNINQSLLALTGLPAFPFAQLVIWFAEQETGQDLFKDVRPIDQVASISPRPVLLIHGAQDALISVENSNYLYAAAGEPKLLYIIPDATHGNFMAAAPGEYEQKLVDFFREFLLNP